MTAGVFGAPAPGFDRPLDVLQACHTRIAKQCDTLDSLLVHLPDHGADTQAQQAARALLAYFDTAAVNHHDDEERNLFPLLETVGAPGACDLVETLTLEHDELALLWRSLRISLQQIEAGRPGTLDGDAARRFISLNRRHIEFENTHVLPLAARVLGAAEIELLGRAMAARRGVAFGEPA